MQNYNYTSNGGYSIIAAVLMVGFLPILTTSTMNLVLQEMQDGRGRQGYLSAYAGAEGALEIALLDIKEEGYGYDNDDFIDNDNFIYSEVLGESAKYPKISYKFNSKVESYTGTLGHLGIDIIPLFSISETGVEKITNINFENPDGKIVWNLITQSGGTSGIGSFDPLTEVGEKTIDGNKNFIFNESRKIQDILSEEDYLILQKLDNSGESSYTLSGNGGGFTLPRAEVISSARVGKYKQNLKTTIDNTEFLGILRYSVYSGN